ncbi:unnamed protein product, partial [marine sediment metagenome]
MSIYNIFMMGENPKAFAQAMGGAIVIMNVLIS